MVTPLLATPLQDSQYSNTTLVMFSLFLIVLLTVLLVYFHLRRTHLPPGPVGLPLVGCIPFIRPSSAHVTVEKWCRKYGGLISFYMGGDLVVVLADCHVIREALVKQGHVFNGRNVIRAFRSKEISQGAGLTGAEGELWKEQRRFCLKVLRDFGAGRSKLEPKIRDEAEHLCRLIQTHQAQSIDIKGHLHAAVGNIIVQFCFGDRIDCDDPIYRDYLARITFRLSLSGINSFSSFNFLPWLLKLPGHRNAERVMSDGVRVLQFLQKRIDEKKTQSDVNDQTDYVSTFLKAVWNGEGEYFHDDQLLIAVQQLFIAGSESTATTLTWVLWYLCKHQHHQQVIFDEIERVIADGPSWSNRALTPYTLATIAEVQRIRTVFPFSVTHRALSHSTLRGYRIPQNAYVVPFIWAIHHDPLYFPQPHIFQPQRFLHSNGQFKSNESFMPFGVGPRICLGEALAQMEIYIFLTTLVQRFKFRFASDNMANVKEPDVVGAVISPAPFHIVAVKR